MSQWAFCKKWIISWLYCIHYQDLYDSGLCKATSLRVRAQKTIVLPVYVYIKAAISDCAVYVLSVGLQSADETRTRLLVNFRNQ